jgi:hypothetical protein
MFAIGGHSAKAQAIRSNETYMIRTPSGSCCTVTIETCREWVGGSFVVTYGALQFGSGCAGMSEDMPWVTREIDRIATRRFSPEGIPPCPVTTTISIQTKWTSCYRWINGWAHPCGASYCIRTCTLCTQGDPTSCEPGGVKVVFVGCSNSEVPCPNPSGNCSVNTCTSQ